MRLEIEDSAFLRAREGKPSEFVIWPKNFPQTYLKRMVIDHPYRTRCLLENAGVQIFVGDIFAKRRSKSGSYDVLVLMIPDCDLGKLLPTAIIEIDVAMLV